MHYVIKGKVIVGDKYGHKLGFPTVNLDTAVKEPTPGVYAGKGTINNRTYRAAIVINDAYKVDAHLLGFRGDAYGKFVTLHVKKFLRNFKKFEEEKDLIAQISKDVKMC